MLNYLKEEANLTFTENGAVSCASTGSDCLDLFATIGGLRQQTENVITTRFLRAWVESPDTAMKLLFFARDIRGGLGERRVFRTVLKWLAIHEPNSVRKNLPYIAEYGRYDDLLSLMDTPCEKDMLLVMQDQFEQDLAALKTGANVSLLGKWLPSINTSSAAARSYGKRIAKAFGLSEARYRRSLSALRAQIQILENNLRIKDYTFDYEKQPSRALFKYRKAFERNDHKRYSQFIAAVAAGKAVLHAEHIAPYELVDPCLAGFGYSLNSSIKPLSPEEKNTLNATWAALPDFSTNENALAVVDTSGSMYCGCRPYPASVALSLGLYFAEHNTGVFRNCFIEFSDKPQLIQLKGNTFVDRLAYAASFNRIANTNLEAVFDLVLNTAVKHHVPQEELPARLIIISDMEFDSCVRNASLSNFENAQTRYRAHGYTLPQLVFWNAASRNRQQPVRMNEQGVILVSGTTPRLFSMIAGGSLSPYAFMMDILGSERYARITA